MRKVLRLFVMFFVAAALLIGSSAARRDLTILRSVLPTDTQFFIYTNYIPNIDAKIIQSGSGAIVCTTLSQAAQYSQGGVLGQSLSFEGDYKQAAQLLNLTQIKTENAQDILIIYGYSNRIRGGVLVEGKTINIQIAVVGQKITIGTPIILGGY